jgi:hypothetical protein
VAAGAGPKLPNLSARAAQKGGADMPGKHHCNHAQSTNKLVLLVQASTAAHLGSRAHKRAEQRLVWWEAEDITMDVLPA